MKLKKSFLPFSFLSTRSGARTLQRRAPKGLRLRFESLENREMLSVTSGNDCLRVQFTEASVLSDSQVKAAAYATTGDSLSDVIDARLEADGQNPEKLKSSYIFGLSSLPNSTYTIYLDFNGHVNSGGTLWQSYYKKGKITTPAYSIDSNTNSFSNEELKSIYEIWLRVSEDFAPFNVNVTTKEPSSSALIKSDKNDTAYGVRICIGGGSSWYMRGVGGVSFVGSFNENSDTPCYVFSDNLGTAKDVAEAISHETGHAVGLKDDGGSSGTYYRGANGWAPIMGAAYSQELTQWSKGEYSGANNREDDLKIITTQNGFSYRSDDYGDNISSAKTISVASPGICASGIIERSSDVDFFKFQYDGGNLNLIVGGIEEITNLDAYVKLYDASGKLVQIFNPTDSTSVTVDMTGRAAGTYYLSVDGTGLTLNGKTIYTDYASLGQYEIVAETGSDELLAPSDVKFGDYDATKRTLPLSWTDNSNNETGFLVQYSKNGGEWKSSATMKANVTSRVATSVYAGSSYQFRVCAVRGEERSEWAYSDIFESGTQDVKEVKAPSNLTLGDYDATNRTLPLSWKDSSNNESGFRVEYSKDGGASWRLAQIMDADSTSRVATGVQANALYKFRVRAFNGDVVSDWTYSETLDTTVRKAPANLTLGAWNASTRRVSLSWKDNSSDETGFRVEYSTDGGKTWRLSQIMDSNATSRVATGVQANKSYQFRVCALYKNARSVWTYSKVLNTSVQTKNASAATVPYKSLLSATFAEFGDDETFDFEL